MASERLETERLLFPPMTAADRDGVHVVLSDAEVMRQTAALRRHVGDRGR
jgi:hypothetical protein